jgi:hypothetical protein
MTVSDIESLPPRRRAVVESAGYRVTRWAAARQVLGQRLMKQRSAGVLGVFLEKWGVGLLPVAAESEMRLTFGLNEQGIWLQGGSHDLPVARLERALLHLPALRGFWRQELRQHHFDELRSLVPQAWMMDDSAVPPGAVIHGLGITSWDEWQTLGGRRPVLAVKDRVLTEQPEEECLLSAVYERNDRLKVVLRTIEASP